MRKPPMLGERDLTPKQKIKLLSKTRLLAKLEEKLEAMPVDTDRQLLVYLKYAVEIGKMQGYYQPEVAVTNHSNVLVVTREESDEIWQKRAVEQQRSLQQSSSLATNTGQYSGTGD